MTEAAKSDPLKPELGLLVKIGSALVHFEEGHSADGRNVDIDEALRQVEDSEVAAWLEQMTKLALLPVMRQKRKA